MVVNYARETIYDDSAVLTAIESTKIVKYITDFPTAELAGHPQVICTPHLGASTKESEETCAVMAVRQLKAFFEFGTIVSAVNFPTVDLVHDRSAGARLVVVNRDIPGMIAHMTTVLGQHGISISGSINKSNGVIGYNLIDVRADVQDEVITEIRNENILRVRTIKLRA